MKSFRIFIIFWAILWAIACSEETDLRSRGEHQEILTVEAVITDMADLPQQVILSKTIPYFEDASQSGVTDALVTVSDGKEEERRGERTLRRPEPLEELLRMGGPGVRPKGVFLMAG